MYMVSQNGKKLPMYMCTLKFYVILYNKFNYCKPATTCMNHVLLFYPS